MADAPELPPSPARYPARAEANAAGDGASNADAARPVLALPAHGGKLDRIEQHAKGLVDDAKEWVELRIKLVQAEVEAQVRKKVGEVVQLAIAGVLGLIGALFLLVTLALFLGWWLGHNAWGFLIVTVLLLGAAGFFFLRYRSASKEPAEKLGEEEYKEALDAK